MSRQLEQVLEERTRKQQSALLVAMLGGFEDNVARAGADLRGVTLKFSGVDVLMGIGGTPEGFISAAAIKCIDGIIECKAWPRDDKDREAVITAGVDIDKIYTIDDLINSDDVFFAATGISSGELLEGVRYFTGGAKTQSLAMRSRSGTIRWLDSIHNLDRLDKLSFEELH